MTPYMTTMNVSLTDDQAKFIDSMTNRLGFANRSEFLRALLRHAQTNVSFTKEVLTCPSPPFLSARFNESHKDRVWCHRPGNILGVELSSDKEGVISQFDRFDQFSVR